MQRYPEGRYVSQVNAKKSELEEQMRIAAEQQRKAETERRDREAYNKCTTIAACNNYLRDFPNGRYVNEVKSKKNQLEQIAARKKAVFSVSSTKKVKFAEGNLQYQPSTRTWRFAEHQLDIIGDTNRNISSTYSGWIDLFGWGTGNNPIKTNSFDWDNFSDWGNNTISNGGGKNWFTLKRSEWVYVFEGRRTSSGIRYAKAIVNDVNGVILLPDNWSSGNYSLSNTNQKNASFSSNRISLSDWMNKLEAYGAIFLPVTGYRDGTEVNLVASYGYYWSATYFNRGEAYSVCIFDVGLGPENYNYLKYGYSVRLVTLAE